MTNKRGKGRGFWIGACVSALILVGIVATIDLGRVLDELGRVNAFYFIPMSFCLILTLYLRALRWKLLLPLENKVGTIALLETLTVGFFANAVLPLRAGEFLRAYLAQRWANVSVATAFASIVIERVFDVLALLIFLAIVVPGLPTVPLVFALGAKALGVLAAGILVFIILAYIAAEQMYQLLNAVVTRILPQRFAEPLLLLAREFIGGLRSIATFRQLFGAAVLSLALWLLIGFFYQLAMPLFGVVGGLQEGLIISIAIALAVAAPSGPGFVGTYQAGCMIAIVSILGHTEEFAFAYSIVTHLFQTVLLTLLGLFILNRHGLMFRELLSARK